MEPYLQKNILGATKFQKWREVPGIYPRHLVCIHWLLISGYLCWLGHVGRIGDDILLEQILFGEFQKTWGTY